MRGRIRGIVVGIAEGAGEPPRLARAHALEAAGAALHVVPGGHALRVHTVVPREG